MTTRRRTTRATVPPAAPIDPLQIIREKFARLTELKIRMEQAKELYKAHDELAEELLPCFVTVTDTEFIIRKQITIGNKVYRLHPSFFNVAKNKVVAKQFKAAFFPTVIIEG